MNIVMREVIDMKNLPQKVQNLETANTKVLEAEFHRLMDHMKTEDIDVQNRIHHLRNDATNTRNIGDMTKNPKIDTFLGLNLL